MAAEPGSRSPQADVLANDNWAIHSKSAKGAGGVWSFAESGEGVFSQQRSVDLISSPAVVKLQ
jgi:hypothetical protein